MPVDATICFWDERLGAQARNADFRFQMAE
jgi:hypothetical protein